MLALGVASGLNQASVVGAHNSARLSAPPPPRSHTATTTDGADRQWVHLVHHGDGCGAARAGGWRVLPRCVPCPARRGQGTRARAHGLPHHGWAALRSAWGDHSVPPTGRRITARPHDRAHPGAAAMSHHCTGGGGAGMPHARHHQMAAPATHHSANDRVMESECCAMPHWDGHASCVPHSRWMQGWLPPQTPPAQRRCTQRAGTGMQTV